MIALDPRQTFKFSLPTDEARGEGRRGAVFTSRFLSAGMLSQVDELTDQAAKAESDAAVRQLLLQALAVGGVTLQPAAAGDEEIALTLDVQADLPAAERTVFAFRAMTAEQCTQVQLLLEESLGAKPRVHLLKLIEAIHVSLVCVKGPTSDVVPLANASLGELRELAGKILRLSRLGLAAGLEDVATGDLWDAAVAMIRDSRLTERERKKSALQLASAAAAKSAGTVHLASA